MSKQAKTEPWDQSLLQSALFDHEREMSAKGAKFDYLQRIKALVTDTKQAHAAHDEFVEALKKIIEGSKGVGFTGKHEAIVALQKAGEEV